MHTFTRASLVLALALIFSVPAALADTAKASPSPSPTPLVTANGVYSVAAFQNNPVNATGALDTANGNDLPGRADIMNLLLTLNATSGKFSGGATLGAYSFPTVGYSLNPTFQSGANTSLYGALPLIDLGYAPNAHLSLMLGKLATMFGQENGFTYQDFNIERGLAWELEPTVQRGLRLTYANGPWSAALEEDDGFYSDRYGSVTSMLAYSPSAATTLSIITMFPSVNAAPNPSMPIANKREFDFMLARQIGKWSLQPYLLYVTSPASPALGYTRNESAVAAVLLGSYAASPRLSFAFRYESARNASTSNDISANADLLGYGSGSSAQSWTVTPTYRIGMIFARAEFARVSLASYLPGLGFGVRGATSEQERLGLEMGVDLP